MGLWRTLGMAIGVVVSKVILCLFFYGVLTPVGLAKRLAGAPPLDTAWRDGRASWWRDKPAGELTPQRYRQQH